MKNGEQITLWNKSFERKFYRVKCFCGRVKKLLRTMAKLSLNFPHNLFITFLKKFLEVLFLVSAKFIQSFHKKFLKSFQKYSQNCPEFSTNFTQNVFRTSRIFFQNISQKVFAVLLNLYQNFGSFLPKFSQNFPQHLNGF